MLLFLQFMDILTSYFRPIIKFPMAHFPQLAQLEILEQMDPLDLFNFSLTSAKNRETVMKLRKWKMLKVMVAVGNQRIVFILYTGDNYRFDINILPNTFRTWISWSLKREKIRGNKVGLAQGEHTLATYWNSPESGIILFGDHIMGMFKNPKIFLYFGVKDEQLSDFVVNWMIARNYVDLNSLAVLKDSATPDQVYRIMKHFTISERLSINVPINFELLHDRLPTNLEMIQCLGPLSLTHFMIMNPRGLYLFDSTITSEILNEFLKMWKSGGAFTRLKHFRVDTTEQLNEGDVLRDIESERIPDHQLRTYRLFEHITLQINGGIDITNKDGKLATIQFKDEGHFIISVWPDLGDQLIKFAL